MPPYARLITRMLVLAATASAGAAATATAQGSAAARDSTTKHSITILDAKGRPQVVKNAQRAGKAQTRFGMLYGGVGGAKGPDGRYHFARYPLVLELEPGGPADLVGMRSFDEIVLVDGIDPTKGTILNNRSPNHVYSVRVRRGQEILEFSLQSREPSVTP